MTDDVSTDCDSLAATPLSLLPHFIHTPDCVTRIEMCRTEKNLSMILKSWPTTMPKLRLAETVRQMESWRKCSWKNKQAESPPRYRCWHRRLSRDFHCSGQLDLTWQRVMRVLIWLQRNKQSSTPPESPGREPTAKCNILKNVAWEKAAHWFSIDYSIRVLM